VSRFQVGDKVRVIKNPLGVGQDYIGLEGEVVAVIDTEHYFDYSVKTPSPSGRLRSTTIQYCDDDLKLVALSYCATCGTELIILDYLCEACRE
jgi:hypothetical protein